MELTAGLCTLYIAASIAFLIFSVSAPDHRRTATVVVCATDCAVYELTERKTKALYFQNPAFGYAVMQVIIGRLLENQRFGFAVAGSTQPASTAAE